MQRASRAPLRSFSYRYECSCLITAIKYVLDHVGRRSPDHDDQLSRTGEPFPDATTATHFGGEARSTNRQLHDVSLDVSPKCLSPVGLQNVLSVSSRIP